MEHVIINGKRYVKVDEISHILYKALEEDMKDSKILGHSDDEIHGIEIAEHRVCEILGRYRESEG